MSREQIDNFRRDGYLVAEKAEENGCLMVVPGSHRGPMYSLFDGATFTGSVDPARERVLREREVGLSLRSPTCR